LKVHPPFLSDDEYGGQRKLKVKLEKKKDSSMRSQSYKYVLILQKTKETLIYIFVSKVFYLRLRHD